MCSVVIRWRRGTWSRLARRELGYARPWIVLAAIPSLVLVVMRPWLLAVGVALIVLWGVSVWLSRIGQERGASNDLLLVTQAALAVPLFYGIVHDAWPPSDAWLAAFVCLVFFTGSVLHVKSLIREADNPRWGLASRVYNTASMGTAFVSPWLLLPFGAAALHLADESPAGLQDVLREIERRLAQRHDLQVIGLAMAGGVRRHVGDDRVGLAAHDGLEPFRGVLGEEIEMQDLGPGDRIHRADVEPDDRALRPRPLDRDLSPAAG
mgnify:CR=1 FL=1